MKGCEVWTYSVGGGIEVGERSCLGEVAGIEGFFGSEYVEIVLILVLENCRRKEKVGH